MNLKLNFNFMLACALAGLWAVPALAEDKSSLDELRKQVAELKAEVARLQSVGTAGERVTELERRIDVLAQELERARTGGATEVEAEKGSFGLGPAASKVYRKDKGVSLGGYGEATYQGGARDELDALRSVFYIGNKFDDRILLNSEIEFEHATTGEGDEEKGEVSVEFAYLDFKPWKEVGLRAGQVLLPMGFLNELHEPPIFSGVRRTETERLILPTTWREVGLGSFGAHGSFDWRAYVVAGLDSAGFDGDAGIREGRQGGAQSRARDVALTGRVEFTGVPGVLAGVSFFTGDSGQGAVVDGTTLEGRVTIFDLHVQYERRGLQLRGLYARTSIGDAALINANNGLTGQQSVGERQYGFYLQGAYDVLNHRHGSWALVPFVRYEKLNTQDRVPDGYSASPENERRIFTAGLGVKPLVNVVLKADYQWEENEASVSSNQLNLGIGYLF
jgi:uncharacterized small protein (DUF1192 family)